MMSVMFNQTSVTLFAPCALLNDVRLYQKKRIPKFKLSCAVLQSIIAIEKKLA